MAMNAVFKITRKVRALSTGTEVQCLMRHCVKEGSMTVNVVGAPNANPIVLPRSRLEFVRYAKA